MAAVTAEEATAGEEEGEKDAPIPAMPSTGTSKSTLDRIAAAKKTFNQFRLHVYSRMDASY